MKQAGDKASGSSWLPWSDRDNGDSCSDIDVGVNMDTYDDSIGDCKMEVIKMHGLWWY